MSTALSEQQLQQLALLKDIDLPGAVSWWPLANGWWISLGLLISVAIGLARFYVYRQRQPRQLALAHMKQLQQRANAYNTVELATQISVLLHRAAIAKEGVQGGVLSDERWYQFLTQGERGMPVQLAEFIVQAPYCSPVDVGDALTKAEILRDVNAWIRGTL